MTMVSTALADWPETRDAYAHRRVAHAFFSDKAKGNRRASESFSPMVDRRAPSAERVVSFGPFHLFPTQRLLLEGETPLRLGSRALDILIALVERPGELVCKRELMARVWPDTVVEEGNLKVHVAALRRALADGQDGHRYLATIPGRGYRFVAPVVRAAEPEIRSFPALKLVAERAAGLPGDGDAPLAADVARKLDRIVQAIELAAARVDALMSATLDLTYGLLSPGEQAVLRRLAIFAGGFTLRAAVAVAADTKKSEGDVIDQVAKLVARSLVTVAGGGVEPRYRLVETTRAYVMKKLAESGESDLVEQRHAAYHGDELKAAS
jgi:DNA-binding winged helix-turn-helix (wHTH) protein